MVAKIDRLEEKMDAKIDGLEKKVNENQQELLAALSCLPRAFGSVATGLRQAAAGGPVLAFVAASRADVAAWLKEVGFEQYEKLWRRWAALGCCCRRRRAWRAWACCQNTYLCF